MRLDLPLTLPALVQQLQMSPQLLETLSTASGNLSRIGFKTPQVCNLFHFSFDNCFAGKDWIDNIGEKIKENTGIDLTSHEDMKKWTEESLKKINADIDVSGNCYIVYGTTTFERLVIFRLYFNFRQKQ